MTETSRALQRLSAVLDEGSFAELGAGSAESGVITGFGSIASRPVYVFAQDPGVRGGSIGRAHAEKILRIYELAIKTMTPVLGLVDSSGIRLDEGASALSAFGEILRIQARAKGLIPQIFAVFGGCGGSMAIAAGMSDFLFRTDESKIFVNPAASRDFSGPRDKISDALSENPASVRLASFSGSESEVFARIKELYAFIPLSAMQMPPKGDSDDDLNRICSGIEELRDKPAEIISAIADGSRFAVVHSCKNHAFGFVRLGAMTAAVIASAGNPLRARALDRMARFAAFAADFDLPLITLTNADGFSAEEGQEELLPLAAAGLAQQLALADVPKLNVITGKASGAVYSLMNSRGTGADLVFAWKDCALEVMPADPAVRIMYADEIGASDDPSAFIEEKKAEYLAYSGKEAFVSGAFIDKLIEPCDTRKYLIGALQMLASKLGA